MYQLEEWRQKLLADVALLRDNGVRPDAIARRLLEIHASEQDNGHWPRFRVPGTGRSHQGMDGGELLITLEFNSVAAAAMTQKMLDELRSKFTAIIGIRSVQLKNVNVIHLTVEPRPKTQ